VLRPDIMTTERRLRALEATYRRLYLLIGAGRLKIRTRRLSIRQRAHKLKTLSLGRFVKMAELSAHFPALEETLLSHA
jgi:hypothetical protein